VPGWIDNVVFVEPFPVGSRIILSAPFTNVSGAEVVVCACKKATMPNASTNNENNFFIKNNLR
jgi:hypothetical protein